MTMIILEKKNSILGDGDETFWLELKKGKSLVVMTQKIHQT